MAVNDAQVRAVKWDGKDYYLNDGNGLYLFVRKSSKRLDYTPQAQRTDACHQHRQITPDIGLKKARNTAAVTDSEP